MDVWAQVQIPHWWERRKGSEESSQGPPPSEEVIWSHLESPIMGRNDSLTATLQDKLWDLAATTERIRQSLEIIGKDPTLARAVVNDMGLAEVYCSSLSNQLLKLSKRV